MRTKKAYFDNYFAYLELSRLGTSKKFMTLDLLDLISSRSNDSRIRDLCSKFLIIILHLHIFYLSLQHA